MLTRARMPQNERQWFDDTKRGHRWIREIIVVDRLAGFLWSDSRTHGEEGGIACFSFRVHVFCLIMVVSLRRAHRYFAGFDRRQSVSR
jgi:hypothetical protein